MATVADLLTAAQKGAVINNSLHIGDVYRMRLTQQDGITPKNEGDDSRNKFFIIVGKDNDGNAIGFVVINSNVNPNLREVIQQLQYPISVSKYAFLKRNSFVNCAQLKVIGKERFSSLFGQSNHKGRIDSEDMELIVGALQSSPIVEPKQLKRFNLVAK